MWWCWIRQWFPKCQMNLSWFQKNKSKKRKSNDILKSFNHLNWSIFLNILLYCLFYKKNSMFYITIFQRFLLLLIDTTATKKILLLRLDILFPNHFSNSIGFYHDMKMIFRRLFMFNLLLTLQTNWLHCKLYSYV